MTKEDTNFGDAIDVHKRVAVAIWILGTGHSYRSISKVFGIGCSSIHEIILECCAAICIIAPNFIKFPTTEIETAIMMDLFRLSTDCVIPQVVGCIDSTHCIICPETKVKWIILTGNKYILLIPKPSSVRGIDSFIYLFIYLRIFIQDKPNQKKEIYTYNTYSQISVVLWVL